MICNFNLCSPSKKKTLSRISVKTGRNRTGSNPPSLKTALLFGGAKRHGFYILIIQKVIGEISNINAFKNGLDGVHQLSNSISTAAFQLHYENFSEMYSFQDYATQLKVSFSLMIYSTSFAFYGPKTYCMLVQQCYRFCASIDTLFVWIDQL